MQIKRLLYHNYVLSSLDILANTYRKCHFILSLGVCDWNLLEANVFWKEICLDWPFLTAQLLGTIRHKELTVPGDFGWWPSRATLYM